MANKMFCPRCGTTAKEKSVTRGSFLIEVFLWCLLILPGLLYSLWRLSTRARVCPSCGAPNMIPLDSPLAQKMAAQ
jgi:ribosomal protein S27AE